MNHYPLDYPPTTLPMFPAGAHRTFCAMNSQSMPSYMEADPSHQYSQHSDDLEIKVDDDDDVVYPMNPLVPMDGDGEGAVDSKHDVASCIRPAKRIYLDYREFQTDEEWRRFYVNEMKGWQKKRTTRYLVEYECRFKRRGCKMALRLVNGQFMGRPAKALISQGVHVHDNVKVEVGPVFGDDARDLVDQFLVENFNANSTTVCQMLKDAGFEDISRRQVSTYLNRFRKCDEVTAYHCFKSDDDTPQNVDDTPQPLLQQQQNQPTVHDIYVQNDENSQHSYHSQQGAPQTIAYTMMGNENFHNDNSNQPPIVYTQHSPMDSMSTLVQTAIEAHQAVVGFSVPSTSSSDGGSEVNVVDLPDRKTPVMLTVKAQHVEMRQQGPYYVFTIYQ